MKTIVKLHDQIFLEFYPEVTGNKNGNKPGNETCIFCAEGEENYNLYAQFLSGCPPRKSAVQLSEWHHNFRRISEPENRGQI
jgi:hypothetical protein